MPSVISSMLSMSPALLSIRYTRLCSDVYRNRTTLSSLMAHRCAMIKDMARKYELKARAERQEETRRRIVEAAIDLHRTIGPAQTSFSAIAERAGVKRHTLYRHFPDERAMGLACSGLYADRNPLPDPAPWLEMGDPEERLRAGLGALY